MAWDNFDTDINSKLPEWWKNSPLALPINRYAQELIETIIGSFLSSLGLIQPVQVWKTIPEEYHWIHSFEHLDERLSVFRDEVNETHGVAKTLMPNEPMHVALPNTKRKNHAYIHLMLKGNAFRESEAIKTLTIRNRGQIVTINNINTKTDIEIWTEDNRILINGVEKSDLVEGRIHYIEGEPRNLNLNDLDVHDENKKTELVITSSTQVDFDLDIEIFKPTYVTEQNMRISTVSAFPLEWIRLFGFYCHDFNNKREWKFLWEKNYTKESRTVYDRITKQYDVETFYIQVKFHGIGIPLTYGFPQEQYASNPIFRTNEKLDYWGRIYQLPRRFYKPTIMEEEEPFTFPKYYPYDIEQDYWYEQRMANEYKQEYDNIDAVYIRDTNLNNIAVLESIDPFMHDVWVYTETMPATRDNNFQTDDIYPYEVNQDSLSNGVSWENPTYIASKYISKASIFLEKGNKKNESEYTNMAKVLNIKFNNIDLPKNIEIIGIELKIEAQTDYHSNALQIDKRSYMYLSDDYAISIKDMGGEWHKGQGEYIIGGDAGTFGEKLTREDFINGIKFDIGFTNTNEYLVSNISIYNTRLCIHYKKIYDDYVVTADFDRRVVLLSEEDKDIKVLLNLKNTGEVPIENKDIYIVTPPELDVTNNQFAFSLDVDEEFTIGKLESDKIIVGPHFFTAEESLDDIEKGYITGLYDIIIFCDNKVIKEEILVKQGGEYE